MKIANFFVFFAISLILGILQSTVLAFLGPIGVLPDLAFLVLVYFTFLSGSFPGEIFGFLLGLSYDVLSSSPFGFYAFTFTLFSYILGKFRGMIQLDLFLIPLLLTSVSFISRWIMMMVFSLILGISNISALLLQPAQLFQALISIIISPLVFMGLSVLWRFIHRTKGFSI